MQPMDQISTAFVYSEAFNITSGYLYHRVKAYLRKKLLLEISIIIELLLLNEFKLCI